MKYERTQECIDLVEDLNSVIVENEFLENLGVYFSYMTEGCSDDHILLGDVSIYSSGNDFLEQYDFEKRCRVEIPLRKFVLKKVYDLLEGFRVLSPFIYKELKNIDNEEIQN